VRPRLALVLAVLCAGALALAPASARADGDPASDVLITSRVFLPYYVKLPPASVKRLNATIAAAKAKGYKVRVAMIDHDYDLGSAGVLWAKPQTYAKFLAQELASFNTDWVLIVMPNGYGIYHCTPKQRAGGYSDPCEGGRPTQADQRVLAGVAPATRSHADAAAAGTAAVTALARLHGADVGGGGGGIAVPLLIAVVVAIVLAAVAALALRRRRRAAGRAAPG